MIAEGKYEAKVTGIVLSEGKNAEQVLIEFELTAPEVAGQNITAYRSLSDKAAEYTVKDLQTLGVSGLTDQELEAAIDKRCQIVVQHEEYDGKTRAKVKFINPLGGLSMATPLQDDKKRLLAAKMKGLFAASSKPKPAPKPQEPVPDDLPF
jgi:hypothetical protein